MLQTQRHSLGAFKIAAASASAAAVIAVPIVVQVLWTDGRMLDVRIGKLAISQRGVVVVVVVARLRRLGGWVMSTTDKSILLVTNAGLHCGKGRRVAWTSPLGESGLKWLQGSGTVGWDVGLEASLWPFGFLALVCVEARAWPPAAAADSPFGL
jgi:hypothetical protein